MPLTQLQRSRQIAFDRQRGRCYYCDQHMCKTKAHGPLHLLCTAEHLLPRGEGGLDDASNIVAACLHCNRTRHRRKVPPDPYTYRAEVRRRVTKGRWHHPEALAWSATRSKSPD